MDVHIYKNEGKTGFMLMYPKEFFNEEKKGIDRMVMPTSKKNYL